ncbi:unnamed protein product, partial [Chrysoparadoxa australica]
GALNTDYSTGDIMVVTDHISMPGLAGLHPLIGMRESARGLGPKFLCAADAYSAELQALCKAAAEAAGLGAKLRCDGCYVMVSGPTYETPAEAAFLKRLGDCAGMSTTPEVTAAAHCGMKVLCLSLVTGEIFGETIAHEDVLSSAEESIAGLRALLRELLHKPAMSDLLLASTKDTLALIKSQTSTPEKVARAAKATSLKDSMILSDDESEPKIGRLRLSSVNRIVSERREG